MPLTEPQVRRLAGLELNALHFTGATPPLLENAEIPSGGTQIFDTNGTLLFHRIPLVSGQSGIGYADVAANEVFGEPLLAVSTGAIWDEKAIIEEATAAAHKGRSSLEFNSVRFVSYSFPKIALQFLQHGHEVLMLEWKTWAEVPPAASGRPPLAPSNFERWSLIDEMPDELQRSRATEFHKRVATWEAPALAQLNPVVITRQSFLVSGIVLKLYDTREVHYSPRGQDHHPCYELRGQQTGVWCVAASTEMLLNFYRYEYSQPRLAQELGLGTCTLPNGLPYGQEYKVVNTIEKLSSNTLDASAIPNPTWAIFEAEIQGNRPLISFIPGHSRTVAGYTQSLLMLPGQLPYKGLLVYDPWPPTDCAHPNAGGVITKWENFATQTYRYAFTAVLKEV
jgi:peptidase C39-like protein